jgi:hypothetical protein
MPEHNPKYAESGSTKIVQASRGRSTQSPTAQIKKKIAYKKSQRKGRRKFAKTNGLMYVYEV